MAAIYLRRRLVAVLLGLSVLALVAWAFSGALGGGAAAGTAAGSSRSGSGRPAHGGSQPGSGGASGPTAIATRGAGKHPARHHQAPGSSGQHSQAAHGQGAPLAAGSGQPRSCPAGDVVLSLISGQQSYGPGQLPQFSVDVVATAPQTCTFDVGARYVALVIHAGSVRVWSSADCVRGAGTLVSSLQRGVPTVLPISWDRRASSPGCPAAASLMPAGTYSAAVMDGSLASNAVTFRIG